MKNSIIILSAFMFSFSLLAQVPNCWRQGQFSYIVVPNSEESKNICEYILTEKGFTFVSGSSAILLNDSPRPGETKAAALKRVRSVLSSLQKAKLVDFIECNGVVAP